jgi:hypothetical protein
MTLFRRICEDCGRCRFPFSDSTSLSASAIGLASGDGFGGRMHGVSEGLGALRFTGTISFCFWFSV